MNLHLNYITNEKGLKTAIQLPLKEWEKVWKAAQHYYEYKQMKSSLTKAFKEVKMIQEGKIKAKTLKEFLDEL